MRDVPRAREEASDGQTFAFPLPLPRGRSGSLQSRRAPFPVGEHGKCRAPVSLPVRSVSFLLQHAGDVFASLAFGSPRQDSGTSKLSIVNRGRDLLDVKDLLS